MPETLRSSGAVSAAVAASRVLGVIRESIFAALFGGGALADAFQVAFRIPNLLRDLFAEGALSSAFVPTFTASLANDEREQAYALGNLVLGCILLITGSLAALGVVFAGPLVHAFSAGFDGDAQKVRLATDLTRVMMPLLAVISVGAVWMGMLNAQRRFVPPAVAPLLFNVVSIATGATLLLIGLPLTTALWWWSVGTMAAGVVQAGAQLPALRKLGYRPRPRLRGAWQHPGVRRIARLMLPAVLGLAAVQLNLFFNTRFASSLGDGPVAQLLYAFRIFFLPVGVFSVALATVTTTRVSEDAARKDFEALRSSTSEGLAAVWMLMSASTVGLLVLASPVVQLLYQRGAFSAADTDATAFVLQAYVLGLLPYGLVKIMAPVFYGLDRARVPLLASVCAVAVNLGFNAATYQTLGAPGLALGTTLGALVNVTILRIGFMRVVGRGEGEGEPGAGRRLLEIGMLVVANAAMGGLVGAGWHLLLAPAVASVSGVAGQLLLAVALGLTVSIGFAVFVGILRLLGYPGAALLWSLPARLLGKVTRRFRRSTPDE